MVLQKFMNHFISQGNGIFCVRLFSNPIHHVLFIILLFQIHNFVLFCLVIVMLSFNLGQKWRLESRAEIFCIHWIFCLQSRTEGGKTSKTRAKKLYLLHFRYVGREKFRGGRKCVCSLCVRKCRCMTMMRYEREKMEVAKEGGNDDLSLKDGCSWSLFKCL